MNSFNIGRGLREQASTDEHGVYRGAVLSECGRYRYLLTRLWDEKLPILVFLMLNPSTADGLTDDATIRSCMRLARKLGRGGIMVVNLFALRSTDPLGLKDDPDPIGPRNDYAIRKAVAAAGDVVFAWGSHKKISGLLAARASSVIYKLGAPSTAAGAKVWCFGKNADGMPKHPLYLPTAATLVPISGAKPFTPIETPNLGSDFDPGGPCDPNAVPCPCCDENRHDENGGCTCVENCPNA